MSVIALTVFIFCLKNTYKGIDKYPTEIKSLELKSNELKSKKEKLIEKFPCISIFLLLEDFFSGAHTKKLFQIKKETDLEKEINSIFTIFPNIMYNQDRSSADKKSKIEKEERNNYISYKYTINNANDEKNNGICMEVKFYYDSKNSDSNQKVKVYHINGIDISLSKEGMAIAKITRGSTKTQPKTNN